MEPKNKLFSVPDVVEVVELIHTFSLWVVSAGEIA